MTEAFLYYRIFYRMSSVYLPEELKSRLIAGARRRGFKVERGPSSELKDYVAYLLELDEERPPQSRASSTLSEARGLLSVSEPPDDEQVRSLIEERYLRE